MDTTRLAAVTVQEVPRAMFLLAGQSNMAGRGPLTEKCASLAAVPHARIAVLRSVGNLGAWASPAKHPLHNDKPDKVGVGPGLAFAQCIVDFLPAEEQHIGLLPCAVGGSELARWSAPSGDLFRASVEQVQRGKALGGSLRGILWHQGESDSGSEELATTYGDRLTVVLRDLAVACGMTNVPIVLGELGVHFLDLSDSRFQYAERVNDAMVAVGISSGPLTAVVSARGLSHRGDRLHFSASAADELGRRYAWKWLELSGHAHGSMRMLLGTSADPPLLSTSGLCGETASGDAGCPRYETVID